jgi:predicted ester cyclase
MKQAEILKVVFACLGLFFLTNGFFGNRMTILDSKKLMEIYLIEVGQNGRLDLIETIAQPDMVDEANSVFGGPPGREGLIAHVKTFRRQIGQLKIETKRIVGNKNEVMAHWFFRGVHIGHWLSRKPTGKEISADVFSFFTLRDGLISHYRLWLCAKFDEPIIFDSSVPKIKNF